MTDTIPVPSSAPVPGAAPSVLNRHLGLPPWLNPLTPWTSANLAASGILREAKALLYIELGEAAARGVPMDKALELCARTSDEMGRRSSLSGSARGADTRPLPLAMLSAFFSVAVLPVAGTLMAAAGMRFADPDRVARKLALWLGPSVAGGATLSAAMAKHPREFDLTERRLVEAGERWDRLPAALKRLGEFQGAEARADRMQRLMFYPAWLAMTLMLLASFVMIVILPKFKDIYDQLGGELPMPTQWAIWTGSLFAGSVIGLAGSVALFLVLLGAVMRCFMNGSAYTKAVFAVAAMAVILQSFFPTVEVITAKDSWMLPNQLVFLGVPWFGSGVVWWLMLKAVGLSKDANSVSWWTMLFTFFFGTLLQFAIAGWLLRSVEALVLRAERLLGAMAARIPVIGAAASARGEARWMGALALGLDRSATAGEALRVAGGIIGGWRGRASVAAAALADAGVAPGEAVGRTGAASATTAARLTLMEGRPDFAGHLHDLADDRAAAAAETTERFARVAECLSVLAVGVVTGAFVIAVYLPLFNIVQLVAWQ